MKELLQALLSIAQQAGDAIVAVTRSTQGIAVQRKVDHSPVTRADLCAHELITDALRSLTPTIPIISEEGVLPLAADRLAWERCWLVDPLDGTRGFIDGSVEYTVNIALIEQQRPVLGVIYVPYEKKLYYAMQGEGAYSQVQGVSRRIQCRALDFQQPLHIAVSQYHHAQWFTRLLIDIPKYELVRMNSSVKICLIAAGVADVYPRLGPTSEWDTAAGQCIVEEAGGALVNLDGQALTYNARATLENPGFIVMGDPMRKDYFLDLIQRVRRDK